MSLKDKISQNVKFKLNNKDYELRVLTISDMAYYEDKYGDINKIMEILNENGKYKDKYSIVYNQLVDKSDFKTQENFFESIKTSESNAPIEALVKVIILSMPPQDKKKAEGEK
jgi:hypothetical protein